MDVTYWLIAGALGVALVALAVVLSIKIWRDQVTVIVTVEVQSKEKEQ